MISYGASELNNLILINGETFVKRDGEDSSHLELAQQVQILVTKSVELIKTWYS